MDAVYEHFDALRSELDEQIRIILHHDDLLEKVNAKKFITKREAYCRNFTSYYANTNSYYTSKRVIMAWMSMIRIYYKATT